MTVVLLNGLLAATVIVGIVSLLGWAIRSDRASDVPRGRGRRPLSVG
jgi:hypothetical protein